MRLSPSALHSKVDRRRPAAVRRWPLGLAALLVLAPAALAQTTGQLSGTVRDAETGEPVIAASVLVEGTTQGASTNVDGEFRIIGVRPGTYTLVASFIGYQTTRLEGVRVNVDLTTTVAIELGSETFQTDEVVVTASSELVRRDLTSSEFRVTSETIDALPVQEIGDILSTQAGVTTSGSGIHIRGGRSKEVAYFVDGVRVTDAYDGSVSVQIENEGIEELQIIAGTYNAEYGQANSGIINVVTKDPGTEFEGNVELFSGTYAVGGSGGRDALLGSNVEAYDRRADLPFLDVDPYSYLGLNPAQYVNGQASLSGPILPNRLGFFTLGRYFRNDGWLYGARVYNPDGTPGDSSLVPMNGFEKFSGQATFKLRVNNAMNLSLTTLASLTTGDGGSDAFAFRRNPDGIRGYRDEGLTANLQFTHTLSNTAFYTLNASTYYKRNRTAAFDTIEEYGNNQFSLQIPDFVPTAFEDRELPSGEVVRVVSDSTAVLTGPGRFLRGGYDLGRFQRETRNASFKGDLTWQLLPEHLVKTGLEVRLDDLFLENYGLQNVDGQLGIPDEDGNSFQRIDGVRPLTVSAYVQDKAEYDQFVINAGLRLDYFDSDGEVPADPQDPNVFNPLRRINQFNDLDGDGVISADEQRDDNRTTLEQRRGYFFEDASPKLQLSPRLGVAYPITSQGVIHFSYGYFFQIPTYEFLFANPGFRVGNSTGTYGPYGNPNLDPQRTVMYEIGLQQGFASDFVLDLTGFYRDIEDWVSVSFPIDGALPGVDYLVYTNLDFSNVRGITAALSKRFNGRFSFDVDYTFQVADGSNSDPNDAIAARRGDDAPTLRLIPLNWDQRHTFNASLFVGGGGWGASAIGRFGTGYPYTPARDADGGRIGTLPAVPTNSLRRPSTATVDLYGFREFDLGPSRPRLFVQVYNLLDARNANGVYGDTGLPDVTFLNVEAGDDPGFYVRPDFYQEPRRVQLGLSVGF